MTDIFPNLSTFRTAARELRQTTGKCYDDIYPVLKDAGGEVRKAAIVLGMDADKANRYFGDAIVLVLQ